MILPRCCEEIVVIDTQGFEPMSDKIRTEMNAFFRHFGKAEYEAAREAKYTGCEPHVMAD
jgi:hypothetical protein